jgi:long-chain acyl-CoA synthetase
VSTIGLWNLAAADPDDVALVEHESGRTATRGELAARTNQIVHAMRARGLGEGGVIAVVMTNEIELLEVFFAALQAGWYLVPINYHLTEREIAYILEDSGTQAVVCSEPAAATVAAAADVAGLPDAARIVNGSAAGFVPLSEVLGGAPTTAPEGRTAGWMMTYTSGTTGNPKGIKRPLSGMDPDDVGEVWSLPLRIFGIGPDPHVHLVQSPFYHTAVLVYVNASVQYGHRVVLMRRWEPEAALEAIERHRVTTTHMVPTHFHRLLSLDEEVHRAHDVSSMRYAVHGAAPCPVETKQRMMELWGPVIYEYYGASEGGGTMATPGEWLERPGTVGSPWPNAEIRILDPHGESVPPGVPGEVWMKAGALDFEYHNSPEKTSESKRDGFFTVGDIGYLDEDGYLFLQGRASEIIITGGVNVHPSEVEAVLQSHEAVADVAVFGIPNPEWGEEIKAVVQAEGDRVNDRSLVDELLAYCGRELAKYKVPRSIDLIDELPRDPNGKLYKRRLQAPYWETSESQAS